jgi:glutathione S-transferase
MASYKLTYFDFAGGRAEPLRIALHAAGLAFEDNRISFSEFGEVRKTTPFNAVPVLDIDGISVTQSNSLSRYVGKLANLYPADDMQALYCDEVMAALEDVTHYIVRTFGLEGDELRAAREKLADGWLTVYLRGLDGLLTRGGGEYFADNRLTVADLRSFVQVRALCSGHLDHISADIVQGIAPNLVEHKNRIAEEPIVAAYYASRA